MANDQAHDTRTTFPEDRLAQAISLIVVGMAAAFDGLASNYALEILQPQPNLTTANRFYKAYPGFEYNVRMAVIGGKFPFMYSLPSAPAGMTINSSTGEITWPSPTASGTPYSVTANVTDSENTTQSVSWTVLVTTAGFLFVDAVNGTSTAAGGTGTIGNPWKTMRDMYGGDTIDDMRANFHAGSFVYWRAGNYALNSWIANDAGDAMRAYFRGNTKANVWLRYPGDAKPVFQQYISHIYFEGGGSNRYLDGLQFKSDGYWRGMGITFASSNNNVVVRRCDLSGITTGGPGDNNALIFINKWGLGQNYVIQDNIFSDVNEGYGVLNYQTKRVLVEGNTWTGIGAHCVGMKVRSERWDVRSNLFKNNAINAIELHYNNASSTEFSGDIEIRHNVIESGGGNVNVNQSYEAIGYPVYIYRNTIMDNAQQKYVTATNGPFYWKNNIIISSSSSSDKIERADIEDPSRLIVEDNLVGTAAENIVDAQGNLTAAYAEFIGTRGAQL